MGLAHNVYCFDVVHHPVPVDQTFYHQHLRLFQSDDHPVLKFDPFQSFIPVGANHSIEARGLQVGCNMVIIVEFVLVSLYRHRADGGSGVDAFAKEQCSVFLSHLQSFPYHRVEGHTVKYFCG
jgi:hypothetical protein